MKDRILYETYTFDDLLLVPAYSDVLPSEVSLVSKLTPKISLNVPICSAAMDTVTEYQMAIALARQGGIGFIHKNMSIKEQARQVSIVKRSQNGLIFNPITLNVNQTLKEAEDIMSTFKISGLPVIDEGMKLVGIITNRDLRFRTDFSVSVSSVMSKDNLITGSVGITIEEAKKILMEHRIEKLPIVNSDDTLCGLITIKDIDNVASYPNSCKDEMGRLRVGAAVGIGSDVIERVSALVDEGVDVITIDSAHGHSKNVIETVKKIREKFKDLELIAGNVVTSSACKDLVEAGANAIKVGVGPGSICTTRVVAGVGVPQLSAISDCYNYLKDKNVCLIADGGIKLSGDIVKALACGADTVMLGSLLAGCSESPGEEVIYDGRKFKSYVGMGSISAMKRGSSDRYFQEEAKKLVPEGIEGRVPYKGNVGEVIYQLCGGLRSGMGYCGCNTISKLQKEAKFVKISSAGLKESHPHDVEITCEAPNYSK